MSPYAVLRAGSDKETPKTSPAVVDEKPHHHYHTKTHGKISLTFFNGDIQFTEDSSRSGTPPALQEENEFQTLEDGCSDRGSDGVKSIDTQSQDSLERAEDKDSIKGQSSFDEPPTPAAVEVGIDTLPLPSPDLGENNSRNRTLSASSIEGPKGNEQKLPALRKRASSGVSLADSLTSSYSAVNKIESMLDDELEASSVFDAIFHHDLKEEITRICDRFEGRPLPQNLVKSVVSLTTPRDVLSTSPLQPPAFVEFSMVEDGYACLFVPSLSPHHIPLSK